MRVLVTGGAGYIGSHTVVELLQHDHDVLVIDDLSNSSEEALRRVAELAGRPAEFIEGNVRDRSLLGPAMTSFRPNAVIHFAGHKAVGESTQKPLLYYRENLDTTLTLLEEMASNDCRRIVFSSSATVYGDSSEPPFREDAATGPTNPYGRTKHMIEQMLADTATADPNLAVGVLRYFNPIGAHPSGRIGEDPKGIPNNLLPFIAQVASGRHPLLKVFGDDYPTPDGTGLRDYIHVVDLARGHLAALDQLRDATGYHVWNLGTGHPSSVLDVVAAYSDAAATEIPYSIMPRRPGDVAASYADPSKAQTELGWQAALGIQDACRDTYRWQQANPTGYKHT